jgi:PAS domain S-box-containing protein
LDAVPLAEPTGILRNRRFGEFGPVRDRAARALLAAAVALPLAIVGVSAALSWQDTWDAAHRDLTRTADATAEYAERVLGSHRLAADLVNHMLADLSDEQIRAREAELQGRMRQLLPSVPMASSIAVADRDGVLLLAANLQLVPRISFADREWVRELQRPDAPAVHVSSISTARVSNTLFFGVSIRRRSTGNGQPEGAFDGVVNISVSPIDLANGLQATTRAPADVMALVRADGEVLARYPSFTARLPAIGPSSPLRSAAAAGELRGTYMGASLLGLPPHTKPGEPLLIAFRRLGDLPVYATVSRPRSAVVAGWWSQVIRQLAVAVPAAAILAGFGLLLLRGQRRLAEGEARLRAMADNIPQLAWMAGPDGHRFWFNRRWFDYTGKTLGDMQAGGWSAVHHPDHVERVAAGMRSSFETGESWEDTFPLRAVDGGYRWFLSRAEPIRNVEGRVALWFGTNTDVTARVEAERRDRYLLGLEVQLREAASAREAIDAACAALGRELGCIFAGLGELQPDGEHLLVQSQWQCGEDATQIGGRHRIADYGAERIAPAFQGEAVTIADVDTDARTAGDQVVRANYAALGVRASLDVPLIRDGRLHAILFAAYAEPHAWTEEEVALARETVMRAWQAVERARAEAGRLESEAQLRAVLDNVPVAVVLAEAPSGRILFGNQGVERLFRHPLRHFASAEDYVEWESYHADGGRVQGREYPLAQVLATGQPAELEVHYACGDGVRRWIRMTGAPVCNASGRMTGALVVCADVDAQRRTAELMARLAEEREGEVARLGARLGAWFEHGTDHLFVLQVTEDGRFVFEALNPAHERATGLRSAELRGKTPAESFPPDVAADLEANYQRCLDAGGPIFYEEQPDLPAGRKLWETTLVPVRDPVSGRIEMILGSSRDVTEQRQMLTRLAQAQRIEALGQLAGGIAHDFNNVLQAVQGGASLIEKRPNDPNGVKRVARMVFEAAERGSAITRRLLAFGRRADLRTEAVDAATLLTDMREIFMHTLGAGVGVRVEARPGLPPLLADKGQLETVLINLAANGRDAMTGNGMLTLAAGLDVLRQDRVLTLAGTLKAGQYIRLSVSDTGTGITPEVLARVTEPFFTTKAQGKGTGLGLAMARGFAEQSGGGLGIDSEPGRGTTVSVWLPVAVGAVVSERTAPEPATPAWAGPRAAVLLVDDEPIVRELTAEGLEGAGYSVVLADSGPAALDLLDRGQDVDVLVSDLSMPGMNGIAVIREAQRRRPGLRAILLTGFAGNAAELAIGGAVSGTFSLLRKPVTAEHLGERISVLLEGASPMGAGGTGEEDGERNDRT